MQLNGRSTVTTHPISAWRLAVLVLTVLGATVLGTGIARAHCDTMNGPVVTAAKKALQSGDVNLVLVWVRAEEEAEIRAAFRKTLAVRTLSPEAGDLADRYFFETLVRVHRAGEGMPFTGLKPAETDVDPGIAAADQALATGEDQHLVDELTGAVRGGVHQRFASVISHTNYSAADLNAGREYVRTYVEFIHYIERVHQSVSTPVHGHASEAGPHDTE